MFSPSRQPKLKTPLTNNPKTTKSPTAGSRPTINKPLYVPPGFLKSSVSIPELKKSVPAVSKQSNKSKISNSSIKDIESKLNEIGTVLGTIKPQSPKLQQAGNKVGNVKVEVKKMSPEAGRKKQLASLAPIIEYKKQPVVRKPVSPKNSVSGKKVLSPASIRDTADRIQRENLVKKKSTLTELNSMSSLNSLGSIKTLPSADNNSRVSFKLNNVQAKKVQVKVINKQNDTSEKSLKSSIESPFRLRQTMSNKQLLIKDKHPDKQPLSNVSSVSALTKALHILQQKAAFSQSNLGSSSPKPSKSSELLQSVTRIQQSRQKQVKRRVDSTLTSSLISAKNIVINSMSDLGSEKCESIHSEKYTKSDKQLKCTSIKDFIKLKQLGSGKYSEVYLALHQYSGFLVAIKQISKQKVLKFDMLKQVIDEVKLHSRMNHPNIVKFYTLLEDSQSLYLVLQYMEGGTLFDALTRKQKLSLKQTRTYLLDVISALKHLHQKSVAHRDIKPENILLGMNCIAKVCDLGWATVMHKSETTFCGTFDYVPPQILQRKQYDISVDVWCLGVLTYELLTGKVPYTGDKNTVVMNKINNVEIEYPKESDTFPPEAKEFIGWLLSYEPKDRPKIQELVVHRFFWDTNASSIKK